MFKCPHCNKLGITFIRKMFLGPFLPTTCKYCHKKVSVPYSSLLLVIPGIIAIIITIVSFYFDHFLIGIALFIVVSIIMSIIQIRLPLIPR